ncbi:MAG: Lrp/AsnC family transcriptional regulator [Candidatus Gallimonas sp.]
MEKLEKDILAILGEDCRYSAEKIAVMLGREEKEVSDAIRAMEARGVIVRYTAIANLDGEDDGTVEAFIEVKVTPQKGFGFDRVAEEIAQHKEVKSLYLMSGAYDFAVIIEGKSLKSISRFVSERISTFDCVLSTATHFILKKYKIEGAVTKNADEERRLSVQP